MKNLMIITIMVVATAIFNSCSADGELIDSVAQSERNIIGFNALNNRTNTRGGEINNNNITDQHFRVWAYTHNSHDQQYMNDVEILYNNNSAKWDYKNLSDRAYWPESYLDFYAICPVTQENFKFYNYGNSTQFPNCNNAAMEYNAVDANDNIKNTDLLFALAKEQTNKTWNASNPIDLTKVVTLKFQHIFSQVLFKVKTKDGNSAKVNSLTIHNVYTKGVCHLTTVPINWYNVSNLKDYDVTLDETCVKVTGQDTDGKYVNSNTPLFMIPQTGNSQGWWAGASFGATAQFAYLEIDCSVTSESGDEVINATGTNSHLYIPFTFSWQTGYKYTYTIILNGGYDKDGNVIEPSSSGNWIEFDVEQMADDWSNSITSEISQ